MNYYNEHAQLGDAALVIDRHRGLDIGGTRIYTDAKEK